MPCLTQMSRHAAQQKRLPFLFEGYHLDGGELGRYLVDAASLCGELRKLDDIANHQWITMI